MTSVPGTDNLVWSDEQTRFYLQLRIEENLKGNVRDNKVNDAGRQNIITKFHESFGEKHTWIKFKNKFNTCKRQYASFRKLTHNRTGIGYDSNGGIDMSDDWWEERCKVILIMTATMALHNFIRDTQHDDHDFAQWEAAEEYEHHGDENEEADHIPYVPSGDRAMEILRDSITEELGRGQRLPY